MMTTIPPRQYMELGSAWIDPPWADPKGEPGGSERVKKTSQFYRNKSANGICAGYY
jgi:hypothetical protein